MSSCQHETPVMLSANVIVQGLHLCCAPGFRYVVIVHHFHIEALGFQPVDVNLWQQFPTLQ